MRNLVKLIGIIWLGITLSIIIQSESKAQSKKDIQSEVATSSPVFFFIYEGDEGDGAIELQIHDRQRQFISMGYDRLSDQARGLDPKNPLIKLIQLPDISPRAFRQAETLEEVKMEVDGLTVLSVRLNDLRKAARVVY